MNLKEYLENELNVNFKDYEDKIDNDGIIDFCKYYEIYTYTENELKRELISDGADEVLLEFVEDMKGLAEAFQYTQIDEDLYVDNLSVNDFRRVLEDDYENDINLMINEWSDC